MLLVMTSFHFWQTEHRNWKQARPGRARRRITQKQRHMREGSMCCHLHWWEQVGRQHSPCRSDGSRQQPTAWSEHSCIQHTSNTEYERFEDTTRCATHVLMFH